MNVVDRLREARAPTDLPKIGDNIRNSGEPLRFVNVEPLAGFVKGAAKPGQGVQVWTNLALTSDELLFHRLVKNFDAVINYMAQQAGTIVNLRSANTVLLVLRPDATAELWLDTAAVGVRCAVKRNIAAGAMVFEQDIVDVTGMYFPCVSFGDADKVLCLFRQDWCFGFAFDMNPDGKLNLEAFTTTLGTLYRELRYKHLYDALNNPTILDRLLTSGWFPFAEIITTEFKDLLQHCEAGFDVAEIEDGIVANFDSARLQRILERWVAKAHFAARADLLKAAIDAFGNNEPIAVIKILLTEIEGALNDAHRAACGGQSARLKDLLAFAEASAERKAGGANTLLFPREFGRYLREHTFANFDPITQTGSAGSRHAVGHGAAPQESYTMPRALQAILTFDQLAFCA